VFLFKQVNYGKYIEIYKRFVAPWQSAADDININITCDSPWRLQQLRMQLRLRQALGWILDANDQSKFLSHTTTHLVNIAITATSSSSSSVWSTCSPLYNNCLTLFSHTSNAQTAPSDKTIMKKI